MDNSTIIYQNRELGDDISSFIRKSQDKAAMLKRSLNTLVNLYTDKTHFIYELLQNAEDAKASSICFIQHNDCFEMLHDGLPFTLSNAKAICDAANSDKLIQDSMTIGKFGVGFKAVFAICDTVKLYSEPENRPVDGALARFAFEIQDYTNPIAISHDWHPNAPFTTRFVFPYDHRERYDSIDDLRKDIAKKLLNLGADTMLFLKHIKEINYEIIGVDGFEDSQGTYMLDKKPLGGYCSKIIALGENSTDNQDSTYIMYSKPIKNTPKTVDIVFAIEESDSGNKPIFLDASKKHRCISVYFPTESESKLKFLVQAPFVTTPNRGGVPIKENKELAEIAADLLKEIILDIKARGWLTLEFLNLLPFHLPNNEWLFEPMYDITTDILENEQILPTIDGGYTTAENANIARGETLTEILKGDILCKLLNNEEAAWLPTSLTETNKLLSGLLVYLNRELGIPVRRADDFPRLIALNNNFFKLMSDKWLERFYLYLSDELETLLKSNEFAKMPFIKSSNGEFYAPFILYGKDRTPNIFIRPKNVTRELPGFNFVADFLARNCIDFIKTLGISEPDGYAYFLQELKDIYTDETINEHQNVEQIKKALKYLAEGREGVTESLKSFLWLNCTTPNGEELWTNCGNSVIYFKTDINGVSLHDYFNGTSCDVYILDQDYYSKYNISPNDLRALHKIGVKQSIYENINETEWSYSPVCWNIGDFRLHLDFSYVDDVLSVISDNDESKIISATLFSLLNNVEKHLKGEWARNRKNPVIFEDTARIVKTLIKKEWLFNSDGELVKPSDISRYDLDSSIYGNVNENSDIYDIFQFSKNEIDENNQLVNQIVTMDTYQLTNVIKSLPKDLKNALLIELAAEIEEDANEFDPDVIEEDTGFPDEKISNLIRLREYIRKQYEIAPMVQYEPKLLRVRVSRGKDRENIGKRYKGYCQMCEKPSRFWEVAEIFNNPTKELEFMNLSLCPTCASKYRQLRNDKTIMMNFAKNIRSAEIIDPSALIDEDCITFTKAHLAEIQMVLELDKSIPIFKEVEYL